MSDRLNHVVFMLCHPEKNTKTDSGVATERRKTPKKEYENKSEEGKSEKKTKKKFFYPGL